MNQRDLTSTDKKVENAKKTSSPLRKKGGNDVSCLNNPCLLSAKIDQLAKLDPSPYESACCNINIKQEPPRKPLKLGKLCKHFLFPFFLLFNFFPNNQNSPYDQNLPQIEANYHLFR